MNGPLRNPHVEEVKRRIRSLTLFLEVPQYCSMYRGYIQVKCLVLQLYLHIDQTCDSIGIVQVLVTKYM